MKDYVTYHKQKRKNSRAAIVALLLTGAAWGVLFFVGASL